MNQTATPPSTDEDIHRTLPHSLEAEQGVLGSMLISPTDVIELCINKLLPEMFYQPAHALIYGVLLESWAAQRPADVITLTQILRDRNKLDEVGGPAFVTHLFTFTPTAANADYYIEIVREKWTLRRLILDGTSIVQQAYEEQGEVTLLLDRSEAQILSVRERLERKEGEDVEMKDDVMAAIETIEKLYERRGKLIGLGTGYAELDNLTGGLANGEMVVIAARPSMGKTAIAMNIAEHVALHLKEHVAIFSLEMSRQQLVQRLLTSRARVNLQKVRDGFLSERDFPNLMTAAAKLAETGIHIDDRSELSIMQLRAKARRWKRKYGLKLVVIDYLQIMRSTSRRSQDNRQLEISEISGGIKGLARELDLPIIVLAQLNRKAEDRAGGRPRLADLRESGTIEQDADIVGLLSRAEYYAADEAQKEEVRGEALLDIAKNRNGPVGEVLLTFLKEYTRFEDRAQPDKTLL